MAQDVGTIGHSAAKGPERRMEELQERQMAHGTIEADIKRGPFFFSFSGATSLASRAPGGV